MYLLGIAPANQIITATPTENIELFSMESWALIQRWEKIEHRFYQIGLESNL
jgi:hypothetical protein